jgi:hypothetical protein
MIMVTCGLAQIWVYPDITFYPGNSKIIAVMTDYRVLNLTEEPTIKAKKVNYSSEG